MKVKISFSVLLMLLMLSVSSVSWARSQKAAQNLYLRDEAGKTLQRSHYVWFTEQRVLVPVRAYEQLGFNVTRDFKRRSVRIAVPNRDQGFTFVANQRTVREPNVGAAERAIVNYERPVLQLRRGEFYIAAMALKEYFPDLIETRWDPRTRSVTIQRQPEMTRLLRFMPKD